MGSKILYYGVLIPISLLPYFVLYRISDFLYIMMYYVIGYRKKVIKANVYGSFPDKTEKEKKQIVKQFYKHFCDLIVESLKNFTISEKQARKRMVVENPEVLEKYYKEGKSVILMTGHYGSWELFLGLVNKLIKHQFVTIYKPLSNDYFENKMSVVRGKHGAVTLPMQKTKAFFKEKQNDPFCIIFGSDQWPSNAKGAYWTNFMNRETPFLYGAEKYAKDFDMPVVYGTISKTKRGYHKFTFEDITAKPKETEYGEIMDTFAKMLENTIHTKQEHWLWSHKRWKKTKEEVFSEE